jgi:hypothetical protein
MPDLQSVMRIYLEKCGTKLVKKGIQYVKKAENLH